MMYLFGNLSAQTWNLVWSDEFNGNSINTSNWTYDTGNGGWGNSELENYTGRAVNATIYKGNLAIVAKKESYGGSNYTSARMKSQGLQSWMYGKVEARIKMPVGKGLWPAFWMLGNSITTTGWPKCGEIDIMEHINVESVVYGTMHWDNNGHASNGGNTACDVTNYHLYSIEWDANAIKWFLDSTKYWEGNIAKNINSTHELHDPFFILLNMAIGGNWPGNPDGTTIFPDTMFVDYVRVYQDATTGIKNNLALNNSISVFPNPANDILTINTASVEKGNYTLEILNLLGETSVYKTNCTTNNRSLSLSVRNFDSGVYLLKLWNNKVAHYSKFVKN